MTLLINGNFEMDWSVDQSHRCHIFPAGGTPYLADIGNIFTPPHWTFWFFHHPGKYDQPEGRDAWRQHDPGRVHSGEKAYAYFTFYRGHSAGLYQQVDVTPGTDLRLSAFAQAWSNHPLPGHEACKDKPYCSCGVGNGHHMLLASEVPPLNGDGWNDAIGNIKMKIGIDPTGGTNPLSNTVVWGGQFCSYNGYSPVPVVEATAQANKVTVFLHSITLWNFKHNDLFWDDVTLEQKDVFIPPIRGLPRIQYERTVVLLPPTADKNMALAVVDATWDRHRYTIGGSADDAGIGDLDKRNIIAVNPKDWGDSLEDFYTNYYPGVNYTSVVTSTPAELAVLLSQELTGDIALSQRDPLWADEDFGEIPGGDTIGEEGCLLTTFTMMLRKAYGTNVNPILVNRWLVKAETPFTSDNHFTNWIAAANLYSKFLAHRKVDGTYSISYLRDMLDTGWLVGLRVSGGEHFVYLERIENNLLYVIDPWTGKRLTWPITSVCGIRAVQIKRTPVAVHPLLLGVNDPEDQGVKEWFKNNAPKGVSYIPLFIGDTGRELHYNHGRVMVNLRYSWSVDKGGEGNIPPPSRVDNFVDACVNTINNSTGVWGWSIGNEMNNPREFPRGGSTPESFVSIYNKIYDRVGLNWIAPGAVDPLYGPGSNNMDWFTYIWKNIKGASFVDIHGYIRGPIPELCWSDAKFEHAPLQWQYLNFIGSCATLINALPSHYRSLPVYITEFNHLWKTIEPNFGWVNDERAYKVVEAAIKRIKEYNSVGSLNRIDGLMIYRWAGDEWDVCNNEFVKKYLGEYCNDD